MELIDTSAWIGVLRGTSNPIVTAEVRDSIVNGRARWCSMVRLELRHGARGDKEKKDLQEMELEIPELPITKEVWDVSYLLADKARKDGITVPAADLLIAACARYYRAVLIHADAHFDALAKIAL